MQMQNIWIDSNEKSSCKSKNMWLAYTNITINLFAFDWWYSRTTSCAAPCNGINSANDALKLYISQPNRFNHSGSLQSCAHHLLLRNCFNLLIEVFVLFGPTNIPCNNILYGNYFSMEFLWNYCIRHKNISGNGMKRKCGFIKFLCLKKISQMNFLWWFEKLSKTFQLMVIPNVNR